MTSGPPVTRIDRGRKGGPAHHPFDWCRTDSEVSRQARWRNRQRAWPARPYAAVH